MTPATLSEDVLRCKGCGEAVVVYKEHEKGWVRDEGAVELFLEQHDVRCHQERSRLGQIRQRDYEDGQYKLEVR